MDWNNFGLYAKLKIHTNYIKELFDALLSFSCEKTMPQILHRHCLPLTVQKSRFKIHNLLVHVFKQDVGRLAWALISFAIVVFCCYVRAWIYTIRLSHWPHWHGSWSRSWWQSDSFLRNPLQDKRCTRDAKEGISLPQKHPQASASFLQQRGTQ